MSVLWSGQWAVEQNRVQWSSVRQTLHSLTSFDLHSGFLAAESCAAGIRVGNKNNSHVRRRNTMAVFLWCTLDGETSCLLVALINVSSNETISKYDLQKFLRGSLSSSLYILKGSKILMKSVIMRSLLNFPMEKSLLVSSTALVSVM